MNYCDKICVHDEHPIAGRDIQYRAPDSQSRYMSPNSPYEKYPVKNTYYRMRRQDLSNTYLLMTKMQL